MSQFGVTVITRGRQTQLTQKFLLMDGNPVMADHYTMYQVSIQHETLEKTITVHIYVYPWTIKAPERKEMTKRVLGVAFRVHAEEK